MFTNWLVFNSAPIVKPMFKFVSNIIDMLL